MPPYEFDPDRYAKYASLKLPDPRFGNHEYFTHTERTLTVQELFPKSEYHLILIPRVGKAPRVPRNLANLQSLLSPGEFSKAEAFDLLKDMYADAQNVKKELEEDMIRRRGFKWDIWMGFHVAPSYRYLHLHIMSSDMLGTGMKKPSHFFSFHPTHGDFIHLSDVIEWEDIEENRFTYNVKELQRRKQQIRDGGLGPEDHEYTCYYCRTLECLFEASNFPEMKAHLKEEFDAMVRANEVATERRRIAIARMAKMRAREKEEAAAAAAAAKAQAEEQAEKQAQQPRTFVFRRSDSVEL